MPHEPDDRFDAAVERLLVAGLEEVYRRRHLLATPGAAAEHLATRADHGGWPAWDAACLHGLGGDTGRAARLFEAVASSDDDRAWWLPVRERAAAWRALVESDPVAFRGELGDVVRASRSGLGLAPDHPGLAALLP